MEQVVAVAVSALVDQVNAMVIALRAEEERAKAAEREAMKVAVKMPITDPDFPEAEEAYNAAVGRTGRIRTLILQLQNSGSAGIY